jgi:hypothetical protein
MHSKTKCSQMVNIPGAIKKSVALWGKLVARVWVFISICVYKKGVLNNTKVLHAGQRKFPKNGTLSRTTSGLAWDTRNSNNSYSEESYQAWCPCRQISNCKSKSSFIILDHISLSSQCNSFFLLKSQQYNFVGRILGPRGNSLKRVEAMTECRVYIRGCGSVKDSIKVKLVLFKYAL